MQNSVLEDTN